MITPTIGRVLWYHPVPTEDFLAKKDDQPMPVLVCAVHSDTEVNVAGFDAEGNYFARQNVKLVQDDETPPEDEQYVEWMPYQKKAQAATTETPA